DGDEALAPLALDREGGELRHVRFLEVGDVAAHIGRAASEIEHRIGAPLTGAVIGELPAAPACVHRKTFLDEVAGPRARARRIERRGGGEPQPPPGGARRHRGGAPRPGGRPPPPRPPPPRPPPLHPPRAPPPAPC